MTDTAALLRDLEALKAAYRSGASTVAYDGKTITFRDGAEMRAAIASIETELGLATTPKSVVVRSNKGW